MIPKKLPQFSYHDCIGCGICVQSCPVSSLTLSKTGVDRFNTLMPEQTRKEVCIGCGICAKNCPMNMIVMTANVEASSKRI